MSTDSPSKKLPDVATIVAILTAAASLFAAVAVDGVFGRVQRNYPEALGVAFACIVIGAATPLVLAAHRIEHPRVRWVSYVGGAIFLSGIGIGIGTVVEAQTDAVRPSVSTTFDGQSRVVTFKVSADGLRTGQKLLIVVDALRDDPAGGTRELFVDEPHPLYRAYLGPDSDGHVDYSAQAIVPADVHVVGIRAWNGKRTPDCTDEVGGAEQDQTGCVIQRLP